MRKFLQSVLSIVSVCIATSFSVNAQNIQAVQIYTDNQLLDLIKENKHLSQVVLDECQLVQDIEARAVKAELPSYQFLWGDMLAYGVCVKKDVELGLYFMEESANQGLPEALEQLGRYYHIGKFMQPDLRQAIVYLKASASMNNLKAQMRLAEIYVDGGGSPLDYPQVYSQLHHSVTADKKMHQKISQLLAGLGEKMPEHVIDRAKQTRY